MKTKKRNYIFLAVLMMGIATMMTGCAVEDIASNDNGGGVNPTDVNVDELNVKVTADMPTAVLSSFDENSMGAALVRRLNIKTNEVTSDTKMILIKGEDIKNRPITEWMQAAKIYLQGGYIAVEKPHNAHLVEVAEQLSTKLEQATVELMTQSGHVTITPPNQQSGNAINSDAARINARVANIAAIAGRRGAASGTDAVAEMVIFSPMGYYQCEPHQGVLVRSSYTDKDGKEVVKEEIHNPDYTKRSSGCLADGAAMWLNSKNAQTPTNRVTNRADGGGAINELMGASEEHYYQTHLATQDWNGQSLHKPNGFTETIRVWGSHNMKTNKDYYFVEQKALSAVGGQQEGDARFDPNKTLYAGPYKEDEWIDANYDYDGTHYTGYYGAWWQKGEYSLNLVGSGTIKLEDALPTTDNNTMSTSIAVGETHSETSTVGVSMGMVGFQPSVGLNYSHGWTNGTSYTMTTTTNTKEIAVQKNTEANKVTWKYENGQNTYKDSNSDKHKMAPTSITTDVNMDNQACWSVENPEGEYTLEVTSDSWMESMYSDKDNWIFGMKTGTYPEDNKYKLIVPNRAEQTWHMDVTFPEIGQEGHEGQKGLLTQYLEKQFPDLYQTKQSLADKTAESENTIKILVAQADYLLHNSDGGQTLREYALDLGISQYTIKWFTTDGKHSEYKVEVKAKE
ncbi:hypothetical protein SAMN04487851_105115 [Prevotella sp. tc2-28]|uniref:hypothetical protein n=1 Tax=Prevotella sp. tc2-28 TaxID=1761888 RepID=UPI000899D7DB|nr:hypothetical protein [Prevotella sp. tc2-28]SEA37885.1 hypothetical protein SAMN04487851_105115 [Prevotella sp. tc2-28]